MAEPFMSEIKIIGFNFAPRGWAYCDGQILPINQHQSLYSLLGTTFGGDGRTTFALPDLRGRTPIKFGNAGGTINADLGAKSGEENVTLSIGQYPAHSHSFEAITTDNDQDVPASNALGTIPAADSGNMYVAPANLSSMANGTLSQAPGGSQAHNNMQPYLTLGFVIALEGLFPSRS
ncbi:MAG: tail fiber protein [Pseudomonadota bacterium]